jgi:hypothetical protein
MSLSLPQNEIQHCSMSVRHHLDANKGVCCKNYVADTMLVFSLDLFHQVSYMAHASINAQDKIMSSSLSLTLRRSIEAFLMPKYSGHILQV